MVSPALELPPVLAQLIVGRVGLTWAATVVAGQRRPEVLLKAEALGVAPMTTTTVVVVVVRARG